MKWKLQLSTKMKISQYIYKKKKNNNNKKKKINYRE